MSCQESQDHVCAYICWHFGIAHTRHLGMITNLNFETSAVRRFQLNHYYYRAALLPPTSSRVRDFFLKETEAEFYRLPVCVQ